MDALLFPEIESHQVFSMIAEGRCIPFYFLGNILIGAFDYVTNSLHFSLQGMVEFLHKFVYGFRFFHNSFITSSPISHAATDQNKFADPFQLQTAFREGLGSGDEIQ
jgi:hypothetical protein